MLGHQRIWLWTVNPFTRDVIVPKEDIKELRHILSTHIIVFHNAKFDLRALMSIGVINSPDDILWEDTLLVSHVVDSGESHELKRLANKYFYVSAEDEVKIDKISTKARKIAKKLGWRLHSAVAADRWMPHTLLIAYYAATNRLGAMANQLGDLLKALDDAEDWPHLLSEYAMRDARRTILLWEMYRDIIKSDAGKLLQCYERERSLLPEVMRMEDAGISLIQRNLESELDRYSEKATEYEKRAIEAAGKPINIRSFKQMSAQLYEVYKLPRINGGSTDAETLAEHKKYLESMAAGTIPKAKQARRFITEVLEYRKQNTARNYLVNYKEAHYCTAAGVWVLFPTFNQGGARTTRFSSSTPNAQNVGKGKERYDEDGHLIETDFKLRSVFGPAPGRVWYTLDYEQLQLRIFAYAANEQSMIDALAAGWDFHNYVASRLFNTDKPTSIQRRTAKNVNFALIFGGGEGKVDATAGMDGAYSLFRSQFPGVDRYMAEIMRFVRKNRCVYTMYGYRLSVAPDKPYVGVNYIVQGTEGDIVKNALIKISRLIREQGYEDIVKLIAVIHDEFIFDFPADMPVRETTKLLKMIQSVMESSGNELGIITPASCNRVDNNWSESVEVHLAS